ncbi:helix-turn-helix domain-containing protein [Sporosarcina sp. FA9]|uniref:helix-turn-helix domain-containing protein n=1 Tax=Sporosarcina sp. FA9 TaxID=3413030 RepID=UPI003F65A984
MVSQRLRVSRNRLKLTQETLAEKVNTTKSTISNYENGHSTPSNEMLVLLSDVLEVTTDYLLGKTENPKTNSVNNDKAFFVNKIATEFPDIDLMFKDMESLSAEQMKEVYDYIKFKVSQKKQ